MGLPAGDPDWMIRCMQVMSGLMDRNQDLANTIRQINTNRPVSEGRYQASLKTLMFFSGQHSSDKRGICPEAMHNIEPSCDKWISRYELYVRTHNLGDEYDRRAFFERLTGQALERMKHYQPSIYTVYELIQILRLRFHRPRTWDDVNIELNSFERKRFEDIGSYMDRYEEVLKDMQCIDRDFTQEMADQRAMQWFLFHCTTPDLREKLRAAGLLTAGNKIRAIAFAQRWYDERGLAPWATGSDHKKKARGKASVNTIEMTDDPSEEVSINALSKNLKCKVCNQPGHEARSCLVSSNMSNIKPKAAPAKPAEKSKEKICSWCHKPRHEQAQCRDWLKVMDQILEARTAKQAQTQQTQQSSNNSRGGRGRGRGNYRGRGNRGRGRGRGNSSGSVNQVEVEETVDSTSNPAPANTGQTEN